MSANTTTIPTSEYEKLLNDSKMLKKMLEEQAKFRAAKNEASKRCRENKKKSGGSTTKSTPKSVIAEYVEARIQQLEKAVLVKSDCCEKMLPPCDIVTSGICKECWEAADYRLAELNAEESESEFEDVEEDE